MGETLCDPLAVTVPIRSIFTVVASVEFQLKVVDPPSLIGSGEAEMLAEGS